MGRLWIVMCFVCVAVGVCGCNLDKDYSMRSGSYQAENWKGKEFMRMRFYREGITTPRFFVGKMERLHGDYRGLLRMDNPTFSEEILLELLDGEKKVLGNYELHFGLRPDEYDPEVERLVARGVKRRHLTVDTLVVPYFEDLEWVRFRVPYHKKYNAEFKVKHDKIVDLDSPYNRVRKRDLGMESKYGDERDDQNGY